MKIHNRLMTFTIIGSVYSFGTFGGLALLHLNPVIQLLVTVCIVYIITELCLKPIRKIVIYGIIISMMSILLQGLYGAQMLTIRDGIIALLLAVIILNASPDQITYNSKLILNICTILNVFVLIAFILYSTDKELLASANYEIYTSNKSLADGIRPQVFTEWLSFTSGDGYTFNELSMARMQGYAPEPSATIVHYFAPAIFGFFLGGRYTAQSVFIILVNVVAISSVLTIFIILCAVVLWIYTLFLSNVVPRKLLIVITALCLLILIQALHIASPVYVIGNSLLSIFDVDLISRKFNTINNDSSLGVRLDALTQSILLISTSPFGFLSANNSAGGGLFYSVCAYLGWLGGLLFIGSLMQIGLKFVRLFYEVSLNRFGLSLLMSTLLFASFISSYGWDRPAGIVKIMILLSLVLYVKSNSYGQRYGIKVSGR